MMTTTLEQLVRRPTPRLPHEDAQAVLVREWLLTNGLGGYASGTISGVPTRRYHGLLVAALPAPLGRCVMLDHLSIEVYRDDDLIARLDRDSLHEGDKSPRGIVGEFRLEAGLPIWEYRLGDVRIEKRVFLPHLQNTVCVVLRLLEGQDTLLLRVRPEMHIRLHDGPLTPTVPAHHVAVEGPRVEISSGSFPPLRLRVVDHAANALHEAPRVRHNEYGTEKARGYDHSGSVWSPGYIEAQLTGDRETALWASTESWEAFEPLEPATVLDAELSRRTRLLERAVPEARSGWGAELVLAADQFIIRPNARPADEALAEAAGDEARTVIAGYHWFTDWGRDTMISLEGLTLVTGRHEDARQMLHTFARHVRDGLIPNLFPEGQREGLYHTADATLWYFHALSKYLQASDDRETLQLLLPVLREIIEWHVRGTHFGIHVDPADGLLSQGAEGYQLTWMDAKVDGWVVTPRRGKAVEINALWYNALRLLENWSREVGDEAAAGPLFEQAARAREAFNRRFWNEEKGCLFDVIDGDKGVDGYDAALRPNQIFALSLEYPVLDSGRWQAVVDRVTAQLLTPLGLRTLAPDEPDYKATYDGDLRNRDAAYHQGTVWGWLSGPFVDAWCKVYPQRLGDAAALLQGFQSHLGEACVGTISEIFDAEFPYAPRGCAAQAWSVAEVLRCWVKIRQAGHSWEIKT